MQPVLPRTARRADGTSTPGGARPRTVRATDEEWAAWQAAARARGVTVSDFLRLAARELPDDR